jgi:hypothetical protein
MAGEIDIGDYELDDDSNGDLVIKDPSDNIVFRWDEGNAQWDFESNPIQGVSDFTADSVSTDAIAINLSSPTDVTSSRSFGSVETNDDSTDRIVYVEVSIDGSSTAASANAQLRVADAVPGGGDRVDRFDITNYDDEFTASLIARVPPGYDYVVEAFAGDENLDSWIERQIAP